MRLDTPTLATHLLNDGTKFLTPIGGLLRRLSIDELPQIWNVLRGKMSFVGPRPALFNQDDLIAMRTAHGIERLLPGITGWAQVNGRDELSIADKVKLDHYYLTQASLILDLHILWLTALKVFKGAGITH